jgi:hypothetical protein
MKQCVLEKCSCTSLSQRFCKHYQVPKKAKALPLRHGQRKRKAFRVPTPVAKSPKPIKRVGRATGELAFFKKLFETRNVCEISGEPLTFDVRCFSHILTKKSYPAFRLYSENIKVVKPGLHDLWHVLGAETFCNNDPDRRMWVLEKRDELKALYNKIPLDLRKLACTGLPMDEVLKLNKL